MEFKKCLVNIVAMISLGARQSRILGLLLIMRRLGLLLIMRILGLFLIIRSLGLFLIMRNLGLFLIMRSLFSPEKSTYMRRYR